MWLRIMADFYQKHTRWHKYTLYPQTFSKNGIIEELPLFPGFPVGMPEAIFEINKQTNIRYTPRAMKKTAMQKSKSSK